MVDVAAIVNARSGRVLTDLVDDCADNWRRPDLGFWELPEARHYVTSKISCWQAPTHAVELADDG